MDLYYWAVSDVSPRYGPPAKTHRRCSSNRFTSPHLPPAKKEKKKTEEKEKISATLLPRGPHKWRQGYGTEAHSPARHRQESTRWPTCLPRRTNCCSPSSSNNLSSPSPLPVPLSLSIPLPALCHLLFGIRSSAPIRLLFIGAAEDAGALVGGEHHERHHGHHRRQPPEQEVRPVRRGRRLGRRPGAEAVRRRRRREEEPPPRSGRRKARRRASVEEQEDLVERPRRGHRRLGLLRVARLPPPHHPLLRARPRHGCAVRVGHCQVPFDRASRRAAGGDVRERRRGRRRPGEQGPRGRSGRFLWKKPEAVSRGDRRAVRGGRHRELVQLPDRHLHRVRVRAYSAGALREVPGPGGRVPRQRARAAPEPVPEARQGRAERRRQVQEERVGSFDGQFVPAVRCRR